MMRDGASPATSACASPSRALVASCQTRSFGSASAARCEGPRHGYSSVQSSRRLRVRRHFDLRDLSSRHTVAGSRWPRLDMAMKLTYG